MVEVALQISGHLRDVCDGHRLEPLRSLVQACRGAATRCDVFLHIWDSLEPTTSTWHKIKPAAAKSSFACVEKLHTALDIAAVEVVAQQPARMAHHNRTWAYITPWGDVQKVTSISMAGVRASILGVAAAVALRRTYEATVSSGRTYQLVVRLRPDLYPRHGRQYGAPNGQVCSTPAEAWKVMVAAAAAGEAADGAVGAAVHGCDDDAVPGDKGSDMCLWGVPRAMDALFTSWVTTAARHIDANVCWQDWRRTRPAADWRDSPCAGLADKSLLSYPEFILRAAVRSAGMNATRLRCPVEGCVGNRPQARDQIRQTAYCPHRKHHAARNATLRLLARGVVWR